MIVPQTAAVSLILTHLAAFASGQTWTSPDGFMTVTQPDATQFSTLQSPPQPFVALWVSSDESMRFGVMKMEIPATAKLVQSSIEDGLAEEIGGQVTRLPTLKVSGHEVWRMTAKSPSATISQAIVRHDSTLYKVMAAAMGDESDTESINRFIDSVSIIQPAKQMKTRSIQRLRDDLSLHKLSKVIGGAGAALAIGLMIYFLMRAKTKQPGGVGGEE